VPFDVTRPEATEHVPCNLCGGAEYEVIGRRDRDGRPLQTVMCQACGLVWTNPRPSGADLDRYYATLYRYDYQGASTPPLRKIVRGVLGAEQRRRSLQPWLREGAVVLDVGCGAGELVYLLRRRKVNASGLEPGEEYAEFARRILGIPVQTATVRTASVAPRSLDVVTMFHCLEHVPDPRRVLATVHEWLREGGLVVVEVPNVASTAQAPSHRFHYAHLYHFTGRTLAAAGAAAGFRVVQTGYSDDGGNVTVIFRRGADPPDARAGLEGQADEIRSVLRRHTAWRHYASGTPYRRAFGRLRRRWREDRLLRRLKTVDDVMRWAARETGPV
jgi:2-polyprenyl-3-methyl-5-hydroxy-6-metoxy-1,4-benzoquinol methylase